MKGEESFITLERLHQNVTGIPLFERIKKMNGIKESVPYVINLFKQTLGLDLMNYFKKVFTLDYIVLNEDRHFHNLGIIMDGEGRYRVAPIFENGKSLLNCNPSINRDRPIGENIERVTARPFSGSHKVVLEFFGKGFEMDLYKALNWIKDERESFYLNVLSYRLQYMKELF